MTDDQKTGYIYEVDIFCPDNLHDKFDDYPLCPEQKIIIDSMLSEHQLNQKGFLHLTSDKTAKLITDLTPKIKYVCHYRNLKLYLELGYKVTKIHQILLFDQEPWMKPYIDINTNLRKQANNDFEKDFLN